MNTILSISQDVMTDLPSQPRPINSHSLQLVEERSSTELSKAAKGGIQGSISFRSHTGATTNIAIMSSILWWRQEQRT